MDQSKNKYEGMFLLDAGQPNTEAALEPVRTVLERAEANVLSLKTWDERRLAYEIKGRKRGLYVLSYFQMEPDRLAELEHDCQLNENIIRALLLRKDTITEEELQASTPAETAPGEESRDSADEEEKDKNDSDDSDDSDDDSNDPDDNSDDSDTDDKD